MGIRIKDVHVRIFFFSVINITARVCLVIYLNFIACLCILEYQQSVTSSPLSLKELFILHMFSFLAVYVEQGTSYNQGKQRSCVEGR